MKLALIFITAITLSTPALADHQLTDNDVVATITMHLAVNGLASNINCPCSMTDANLLEALDVKLNELRGDMSTYGFHTDKDGNWVRLNP